MKKKILSLTLFLLLILSVTVGCSLFTPTEVSSPYSAPQVAYTDTSDNNESITDTDSSDTTQTQDQETPSSADSAEETEISENKEATDDSESSEDIETSEIDETSSDEPDTLDENGSYTSKDDVALYLYTYGKLPDNFITKKEAQALGWEGGSLEPFAPGKCIGGDRFGNYEGLLPKDKSYHECDIDTLGQRSRGAKRIVFSDDGCIYYTEDHYESFTLLYGGE